MTYLLQQSLNALQTGSIYALIALGYTMVYGILTLINFAHGDLFMVGAFLCFLAATFLHASFIAAVVGGIGSIRGAMLGGYILGAVEILVVAFLPSTYRDFVAFALLIVLIMVYLGGGGSLAGSILGATAYTFLLELLRPLEVWRMVLMPLVLVLLMLFRPRGIMGLREWRQFVPRLYLDAVADFQFSLEPGELVGLIGPNGAGKTTIFNLITGVYRASAGRILFDGTELVGKTPSRITALGIARTFQNIRLFRDLTVLDNVRIAHSSHTRYSPTRARKPGRFCGLAVCQVPRQAASPQAEGVSVTRWRSNRARWRAGRTGTGGDSGTRIRGGVTQIRNPCRPLAARDDTVLPLGRAGVQ